VTVATVHPLPGVRHLGHQRLSFERRVVLLGKLARQREWLEPEMVADLVAVYAHDSLTPSQRDQAWEAVLRDVALADSIEVGVPVDWDWRCSGPGGCGHRFAEGCPCGCCPSALEHARDVAAESLAVLAGGIR
jgi:hypothetical protein